MASKTSAEEILEKKQPTMKTFRKRNSNKHEAKSAKVYFDLQLNKPLPTFTLPTLNSMFLTFHRKGNLSKPMGTILCFLLIYQDLVIWKN